jgi:peptidoglycan/xylan/chitin deacetylase (PgdA/CDA1 family)
VIEYQHDGSPDPSRPGAGMTSALRGAARTVLAPAVRRLAAPLGSVVAVRTSAPEVVLTFDDGPEAGGTDRVLAALAEHDATATFFVLLSKMQRHGGLLDEVLAAGHEIGLHGLDHRALPTLSSDEVERRTREGRAALEDRTGREIRWFRPPYGRQTFGNWRAITRAGMVSVLWAATTWDWRADVTQAQRVEVSQRGVGPGVIVLAHDAFAGPDDCAHDGPEPVLDRGELIDEVLRGYAARGLVARSLGDALVTGRAVREARFPG